MKKVIKNVCILLLAVLTLAGNTVFSAAESGEEAAEMREILTITDQKHSAYVSRLTDGVYNSYVSYEAKQTVSAICGTEIGYAYIAWQATPSAVTLAWVDKNGKTVSSEQHAPVLLDEYIPAPGEGICGFILTFKEDCSISELNAYTAGKLPDTLPVFEKPMVNAAVMVITGYPGDELVCFGGLLPSLVNRGVPVQLVYLNHYNRGRQQECLNTLWKMGMRNAPIFLNTSGKRSLDGSILKKTWEKNGDVSKALLNVLNTYKPSVIVTHGEEKIFPLMGENAATYSVFDGIFSKIKSASWLKKVYLTAKSGDKKGSVYSFTDGYEQAASFHYEGYVSMRTFQYTPNATDAYVLYHTSVGSDAQGDMLENISYTALSTPVPAIERTPEPTAEPTPEPTPEPTEEPTAEPTDEPTATPTVEPTASPVVSEPPAAAPVVPSTPAPTPMPRLADTGAVLLPILLSLLAAAILFGAFVLVRKLLNIQIPTIVAILIPVLAGAILSVGLYRAAALNQRQAAAADRFEAMLAEEAARTAEPTFTPAPTAEPTKEPSSEPAPETPTVSKAETTPAPTAEPTTPPAETSTAVPTATPDPDADLYSDGEEIVTKDEDAGKWTYKSSTLAIEINRYTGSVGKMEFPYYVADIHMRDDEFRTGFGSEDRNGKHSENALTIAKRYKAVLMITGDNILNMDWDKKGVLIRDGYIYNNAKKADIMIWNPENRAIDLVSKDKISSASLVLEGGAENVISFGPILIKDGERAGTRTLENNWLYKTNPRVGIGMIEPGHFIVVVGGYRSDSPKANLGWTLVEFADIFQELGCTQAYNVDGGVSACMVFMGERLNKGGTKKDWSKLRNLPDSIIFGYSENVSE